MRKVLAAGGRTPSGVLGDMRFVFVRIGVPLVLLACGNEPRREVSSGTEQAVRSERPQVVASAPSPYPGIEAPSAPEREVEGSCEHAEVVAGKAVAVTWPSRIGRCVRMSARVVRSVDTTRALVRSDGASFIVWMSPGDAWSGTKTNTFVVMGSGAAPLHGRTALPELLLHVSDTTAQEPRRRSDMVGRMDAPVRVPVASEETR